MYQLLDSGDGRRLEKFGDYILDRPDPQIIWHKSHPEKWQLANAVFTRTEEDKGNWEKKGNMPGEWLVRWDNLRLWARLTPFKHTGIFPEQQEQWSWIAKNSKDLNVLNLFGYTGIASLVAAQGGAKVTYVDASRSALTWARKNQEASDLTDKPIRWILDDCLKYVAREVKRGVKYDAIIMDPPAFGHGPTGETWQFNRSLPELLDVCAQVLSEQPKYVLINAYAISTSALTLGNVLHDLLPTIPGTVETGELVLGEPGRQLSTGIWGKWTNK